MGVDGSDDQHLLVYGLEGGAFFDYNKRVKPSLQLRKSDFILSVNEVHGGKERIKQFKEPKVTCVIARGTEISCILEREDLETPLGLEFLQVKKRGYGLPIASVSDTEGAAKEYNDKCAREWHKLRAYDRIVCVEGSAGSPPELKAKIDNVKGKFQVWI